MEAKEEILKKRPTLKKTSKNLKDDLTLAQMAPMQKVIPNIKEAQEKIKVASSIGGKRVILEEYTQ